MALSENIIAVAITSMLPIAELRGGIPLGIALGIDPLLTFIVSVASNALVFFPVYFGLKLLSERLLKNFDIFQGFVERTRKNGKPYIDKYGTIGLALFVGIPLPVTGAWTGTLLAWLMGLEWKRSFLAVGAGVLIAGIIIILISLGVLAGLKFLL